MIATHQGYLLGFCKDLDVEGMGVAMLDMQLDTRESHELGYGSLKFLRATRPRGWFWCVQMGQQWIYKGEGISKSYIFKQANNHTTSTSQLDFQFLITSPRHSISSSISLSILWSDLRWNCDRWLPRRMWKVVLGHCRWSYGWGRCTWMLERAPWCGKIWGLGLGSLADVTCTPPPSPGNEHDWLEHHHF